MDVNLLDRMLNQYKDQKAAVTVVLQNRARVTGTVRAFDNYVLILEGQRTEIVYRHAVSSLMTAAAAAAVAAERPAPQRAAAVTPVTAAKPAVRPSRARTAPAKKREPRPAAKPAPVAAEPSLNNGMKEGLLRWMQEQKAGK